MSQNWQDLFGTIDVSTAGLRANGLKPVPQQPVPRPAPPPVASPTVAVATAAAAPPKVTVTSVPPAAVATTQAAPKAVVAQAAPQQASPQPTAVQQYPGVWTMAQTFTASASQFVSGGMKTVSREVREERLAICKMCPQFDGTRCIQCGCFIAAKTWMPHEKCPAGKWPT